ncbi:MAG: XcyI family restriction endonuclease [Dehalococcoidia bacterium]|nr:XcyI family restriction endonuclease [Dehalococcoidia bacterium]
MIDSFHPELQIAFAVRLEQMEEQQLGAALARVVQIIGVSAIDAEMARAVPPLALNKLAAYGLRGETFFPLVCLLQESPRLLGYYRLLYGLSQKEFFRGNLQRFKRMEDTGTLTADTTAKLAEVLDVLVGTGVSLLDNLSNVSIQRIRDLQLLTRPPAPRSRLNTIGQAATEMVFRRIRQAIADTSVLSQTATTITLLNAAGRTVSVSFSATPTSLSLKRSIQEFATRWPLRSRGADRSNIHNRLGGREVTQRRKRRGSRSSDYYQRSGALATAQTESPDDENLFFNLDGITDPSDEEWAGSRGGHLATWRPIINKFPLTSSRSWRY